jgi:hypothetical protein
MGRKRMPEVHETIPDLQAAGCNGPTAETERDMTWSAGATRHGRRKPVLRRALEMRRQIAHEGWWN